MYVCKDVCMYLFIYMLYIWMHISVCMCTGVYAGVDMHLCVYIMFSFTKGWLYEHYFQV